MANEFHVHVLGLDETIKKLREIGDPKLREGMYRLLNEHGRKIRSDAKGRVPVDTGRLKRSISMRLSKRKMYAMVFSKETQDCYHARFIEYGTRAISKGEKTKTGKRARHGFGVRTRAARPFMGPAARSDEPGFVADVDRLVRELIES